MNTLALPPRPVLLIGGGSFIGRHLGEALVRAGMAVVATGRVLSAPGQERLDLLRPETIEPVLVRHRPGVIINCGGITKGNDPAACYALHVDGTRHLLALVAAHVPDATTLLFGSAAELGPVAPESLPANESCPANPGSFYGASKLAQTHLAAVYAAVEKLSILILRPFNIIGPGLPEQYFLASLAKRLLDRDRRTAEPTFTVHNATSTRDFIDVRDVADAVLALIRSGCAEPGRAKLFHLATGVETSILDAATLVGELAGGLQPLPAGAGASRGGIDRSRGDSRRLQEATGWKPRIDWRTSVADLWHETTTRRDLREPLAS